jgi:hypothetical protein
MTWYAVPDVVRPEWDEDGCTWVVADRQVRRGEFTSDDTVVALCWSEDDARFIAAALNFAPRRDPDFVVRWSAPWSTPTASPIRIEPDLPPDFPPSLEL